MKGLNETYFRSFAYFIGKRIQGEVFPLISFGDFIKGKRGRKWNPGRYPI